MVAPEAPVMNVPAVMEAVSGQFPNPVEVPQGLDDAMNHMSQHGQGMMPNMGMGGVQQGQNEALQLKPQMGKSMGNQQMQMPQQMTMPPQGMMMPPQMMGGQRMMMVPVYPMNMMGRTVYGYPYPYGYQMPFLNGQPQGNNQGQPMMPMPNMPMSPPAQNSGN